MRGTTWDIFCTVIDNYGDIGITWRLARQLAAEHGILPRLWVDDLHAFRSIHPEIDPALTRQEHAGVEIRHWSDPMPTVAPGQVVIEALACNLPEPFIQSMASRQERPLWINLEYLSAENWVRGCHGLPSPHPRLPLVKHFFMPGYVPGTGGVLREAGLEAKVDAFQQSAPVQATFWRTLGLPCPDPDALTLSLFAYETASLPDLLDIWSAARQQVEAYVPAGKLLANLAEWSARPVAPGYQMERGSLRVHVLPMLAQDDYDRLLWACDCNFVRGEDSLVRAQWAARPLVWQAYRQEEEAHWPKIDAFLDLYCADLEADVANALRGFWTAWNADRNSDRHWLEFHHHLPALRRHAKRWPKRLSQPGDLAANLVRFCEKLADEKRQ